MCHEPDYFSFYFWGSRGKGFPFISHEWDETNYEDIIFENYYSYSLLFRVLVLSRNK